MDQQQQNNYCYFTSIAVLESMVGRWCHQGKDRCLQKLKLLLEDTAVVSVTIFSIPTSLVPQVKRQGGFPELPSVTF